MTSEIPVPEQEEPIKEKRGFHIDRDKILVSAAVIYLMAHGFSAIQSTFLIEQGLQYIKTKLIKGNRDDVAHS